MRPRRALSSALALCLGAALLHGVVASAAPAAAAAEPVKVIADNQATAAEQKLRARGAVKDSVDYGSYRLLLVDEQAAGGRGELTSGGLEVRDDMDVVRFGRDKVDTRRPGAAVAQLQSWERRNELANAQADGSAPKDGLYVVQFVGPVKDAWLAELDAAGFDVVSYVPENAYVVRAAGASAGRLLGYQASHRHVQYVGDFHPAYRLSDELRPIAAAATPGPVDVTVQVVDGPRLQQDLADLRTFAEGDVEQHKVLNYRNVQLTVDGAKLRELAAREYIFQVERRTQRTKLDEAQGQISAGNLSGNAPTGPGYLSWLAGKGFADGQFPFSVNVVDDAYSLTGHPDLPNDRVAFQHNPTAQTGPQGGHGFLNAHIVGGFNDGTGAAVEDAQGFNYGLGIAPWAKVGVTAIFGNSISNPTTWESAAYGQGARISSNSWGYTGVDARKYDINAQEYDYIVRDAQAAAAGQPLSVIFAAGNSGSAANTVSSPSTAKNVVTVGASENVRQTGTDGCAIGNSGADSANDIIAFSSRGPVNSVGGDGRIKPDIVAPGTHIEGGVPQTNYDGSSVCNKYWPAGQTLYGWSSGTSHSTPAVAGGAALVYQDFLNKGRPAPSPAMVKAYLLNSARHMNGVGANDTLPSNIQGMGRMDLGRAFSSDSRVLVDQSELLSTTGQTYTSTGTVAGVGGLRVSLAWTDAAGPTTGAPWVNNLDLEVTVGGTTYKGNVFSGASSIAGGTADAKNNVESVFLPAATGAYSVTVRGTNVAGDGVPGNADTTDQDFALVISNATAGPPPEQPEIGVSPSSLSFSGVQGGANPASKTLSISNTGGGTLNWTASDDAPWLSVSPTSGTAPSSATVSVNTAGLTPGTHNGTITVSGTDATNSPVSVPVTLTVTAAPITTQLLTNGGFEASLSPWVLSGPGGVYSANGAYPHGGTGYVYLGNAASAVSRVYQTVKIPSNATAADLRFWLNVTSSDTSTTAHDTLAVEVRNTSGSLLKTLTTFSNRNRSTAGNYTQRGAYSLLEYKGQTVRVQFRATTNSSLQTTFRIDDASAIATLPGGPPTIGASPGSLSFSGFAGGNSPASKTVAISNTGGDTLSWSASDDAPWLSLSPTSGTEPSSLKVSVNSAGLSTGTHNGAVTITGTGATNSPRTIPVSLTLANQPIGNGGFEGGVAPWTLAGTGAFWTGTGSAPHTGTGYAYLGAGSSRTGNLYQLVTIPSNATRADLRFWLNVSSSETTTSSANDKLTVEVRNTAGTLLKTVTTFSNLHKAAVGSYTQRGAYSLLAYKGQTVRLQFRATTNSSLATTFRIDDVWLS